MELNATAPTNRFEGRLFTDEGRLHLVLDVEPESGLARVSCRADGVQRIIRMPISEIGLRLSSGPTVQLDGLTSANTSKRITRKIDGWFFPTREGLNGPFPSEAEASQALRDYIVSVQGTDRIRHP